MCEIGDVYYGFCEGAFGRDSYGPKRVEGFGADWIVCRESNEWLVMATFESSEEKNAAVEKWRRLSY